MAARSLSTAQRAISCVVTLAALAGVAIRAVDGADLAFEQISWLDHAGASYTSRYSDWGEVKLSLSSADHSLFHPMTVEGVAGYGGFVNIVTDAAGSADWEVRNLPIWYTDPLELDGRLPQGVSFDLGVSPGTIVSGLNCYYTVNPAPLALMPAGTFVSKPVTEFSQLLSGDNLWLGTVLLQGGGLTSPQAAMDFPGAESGEVIGSSAKIAIPEKDVAAVNEDKNGCAPGAVARSIKYMADAHPNVNVPDSAQTVYGQLRTDMGTTAAGTDTPDILSGKNTYVRNHNLPITSTQTKSFKKAMDTLKNKGDVEVGVRWGQKADGTSLGAHRAFVTEVQELQDANGNTTGYVVKTMDDPTQGDGTAANSTHTMKFDANGKLLQYDGKGAATGAGLINFQTEDVHASKVTLEYPWGGSATYPIPPGGELPFGIPVGRPGETTSIGGIRIRFEGVVDNGDPGNPVNAALVVNPANLPGPLETLDMSIQDVTFNPIDPVVPSTVQVGLDLRHVQPDEISGGTMLPVITDETEIFLENLVVTSSFFDVTYQIGMPGEAPQVFRLHGEIAEPLLGKAWLLDMDPDWWVESFFDVFVDVEVTPDAYGLLGPGTTLLNMQLFAEQIEGTPVLILGDVNGDGVIDGLDIQPFVDLLTGGGYQAEADINGDSVVDGLDIQPFVDIITGAGGDPVPEPATLSLLALGGLFAVRRWR